MVVLKGLASIFVKRPIVCYCGLNRLIFSAIFHYSLGFVLTPDFFRDNGKQPHAGNAIRRNFHAMSNLVFPICYGGIIHKFDNN